MVKKDRAAEMESQDVDDIVAQTSRVLEELFKAYSRHSEFIPSVLWCLRVLLTDESFEEECQQVVKSSVHRLAEFYSTKPLWTQYMVINELRRLNIPELAVLLGNAFRTARSQVTVPLRLLLNHTVPAAQENEQIFPSYAMAVGENSSFTLGVAADGPVPDARKVPLEAVKKVSMSNSHSLFLMQSGEVFGCGLASNFGRDESLGSLLVNPVRIDLPGENHSVVDIAVGPHHSIFITSKSVYVCGLNSSYCLGLKKDKCRYPLTKVKLPLPEGVKRVHFDKVFTNAHCTAIYSFVNPTSEVWITGKTPLRICESFTRIERSLEIYEAIRSDPYCLSASCELGIVATGAVPAILPVSTVTLSHKRRNLTDSVVTLCNSSGTLKYTFDPHSGRAPLEPCVISVNGVLVNLHCVDYNVTAKGDVIFMGYPGTCRPDFYTLYRGKVILIEDKVVEDGFTSAYVNDSTTSGLHVFLLLQEIQGAHMISSFACSQDGNNLIYVTNSSTIYRSEQWGTFDFARLNEERENACLDRIPLDFHVYDMDDKRTSTFASLMRTRFPNLDKFVRDGNTIWIEDLSREVTVAKSGKIFHDYLIFNENRVVNRGSHSKVIVENVCRVIGVPFSVDGGFYKIGEPLLCLEDFAAERDCVLISEEGVEIEFVRSILEMQSSYFGVAFTYHDADVPRLRLSATENVIRYTLLSIINPNYLRRLQIHEFLELLPFLDQYLLYAVIDDALRVIFERVNEFNMNFIFDLFEAVPQLRHLIAKYFHNNLHLLTMWKNSAAAPIELIRDVFAYSALEVGDDSPNITSSDCANLQPPIIHILEDHRRAQWCFFRNEDVVEVLLGAKNRDPLLEAALLEFLEDEYQKGFSFEPSSPDTSIPELVMTIRSRLAERDNIKASKRDRRKSSRQSGSEVATPSSVLKEESEICDNSLSKSIVEEVRELQTETFVEAEDYELDRKNTEPLELESAREEKESVSPVLRTTWNAPVSPSAPTSLSVLPDEAVITPKKRGTGRFTPKGAKFRDASNLLCEPERGTHFAPWAGITTAHQKFDVTPLSEIFEKEAEIAKLPKKATSPLLKQEGNRTRCRRSSGKVSWSETVPSFSPAPAPLKPSFSEIMKEEEHRLKQGTRRISRPLHFIEDEERAIEELIQLYRENVGDEVIVRVERCINACDVTSSYSPLWANTPHFRI